MVATNPWPEREEVTPSPSAPTSEHDRSEGVRVALQEMVKALSEDLDHTFARIFACQDQPEAWTKEKELDLYARLSILRTGVLQIYWSLALLQQGHMDQMLLTSLFAEDCRALREFVQDRGGQWEVT